MQNHYNTFHRKQMAWISYLFFTLNSNGYTYEVVNF